MSLDDARVALFHEIVQRLPEVSMEGQNLPFQKPSDGSRWGQLFFLPVVSTGATVGVGGYDRADGLVQLTLNYPNLTGDELPRSDYERVSAGFTNGTKLSYLGQDVRVRSCRKTTGKGDYYQMYITIEWYAFIKRSPL
jgi:hypothetical protein